MYTHVKQCKARSQWEANSLPCQSTNCGASCVTFLAKFFRDKLGLKINTTRKLAIPSLQCWRGAKYSEQQVMLAKRKVPNVMVRITSLQQLRSLTGSGRRPVILFMNMGRVPRSIRGYNFSLMHSIVCMYPKVESGVSGFRMMDPNFRDKALCKRFYPDWVIQQAFLNYSEHYALVPLAVKKV